jgi:Xaa-Pro dipeptidase
MQASFRRPFKPKVPQNLERLLDAEMPVFSDEEMQRRRAALARIMEEAGAAMVLLSGGDRKGSAIQWLTGWPPGGGHLVVFSPGEQDALFVKNPNNAPLAGIFAPKASVRWSPEGPVALAIEELLKRGSQDHTVGIVGSYGHSLHERLVSAGIKPLDLTRRYTELRLVKSSEELDWLRIGCALTDCALEALERELGPGISEHDISDIIERSYVPWGGMTQIHYTGVTSMEAPDCCVPSQLPRNRKLQAGDVVVTEISASFWSYPGQVQRTFVVDAEPNVLYRDMHAAADEAFESIVATLRPGTRPDDILDAATCIAAAGFTICDDLVHGYGGGGYLPPILGTRERPSGQIPNVVLSENMTIVVQPSVVTTDGKAGVQTGELMRITSDGVEFLHKVPKGLRRVGRDTSESHAAAAKQQVSR